MATSSSTRPQQAEEIERDLGYFYEDGMYWNHLDEIDETFLADIDRLWMSAVENRRVS
ncbi:hypothetical protein [Mesorhizobium sp. LjRoot246]|uniref:hypothetical protein n=1 Tax=Mesorhizobium sp. LjRoot246 TaxID=3342294 RepID=UPI003ED07A02